MQLGNLTLADIYTNAELVHRAKGSASRGDDSCYFLVLQCRGSMRVRQADEYGFTLKEGDIALYDSAYNLDMAPMGLIRQLSLHLPRSMVDRYPLLSSFRFGKINSQAYGVATLKHMLANLAAHPHPHDHWLSTAGQRSEEQLNLLFAHGINTESQYANVSPKTIREQAEDLILAALPDPISPAQVAAQLGISLRQLYRHFSAANISIASYIREARIRQSALELSRPESRVPLTTLAHQWGFADLAHFSRTFKHYFGVSPREYRNTLERP